jgi:hypothetical protein
MLDEADDIVFNMGADEIFTETPHRNFDKNCEETKTSINTSMIEAAGCGALKYLANRKALQP